MKQKEQEEVLRELALAIQGLNQLLAQALVCQPKEKTSEVEFTLVESHNALTQLHFHLLTILKKYQPLSTAVRQHDFLSISNDNSITYKSFEPMESNTVH
tara:strand:+ start:248 stop:547 length:300 start_codon:yes stop_codon:yes gene_type:complete